MGPFMSQQENSDMIKLVLLVAVIALGLDALLYDGAYTQMAYYEISALVQDIRSDTGDEVRTGERPT